MTKNLAEERLLTAREALLGAYPPAAGQEPGGLPFKKVLAGVFRSRWFVSGCAGLGCVIGSFLAVTTPNTYVSEATFRCTTSGSESINVDLTQSSDPKGEAIAANAVHVLKADTLLRRVATKVTPEEILRPYQPDDHSAAGLGALLHRFQRDWNAVDVAGATVDDALKVLRKRLNVDRSRLSDVLVADYTSNDPKLAQKILAVYMEEAKRYHQEQYDDPKVYDEVKKRTEDSQRSKDATARQLKEFLEREAHVQTFEFELERLRTDEAEASARVVENQLAIDSGTKQIEQLQANLAKLLPTTTVHRRMPTIKIVEGIQEEVQKLQIQRARVSAESAGSADVEAIDRRLETLRRSIEQIAKESLSAPEYDLQEDNPDYFKAKDKLADLRNQLIADQAITPQLTKRKGDYTARLRRLLELQPRYLELRDAAVRADEDVRAAGAALRQADLKRELQLGNFSSLRVIDDASLPLEKEGPNRLKLILGGLVVGLFAGLGLVLIRTMPDQTVRVPGDLEALDGVTVIGVMPRFDGRNVRRHVATRMRGW